MEGNTVPRANTVHNVLISFFIYICFAPFLLTPRNLVFTAGFIAQTETGRRKIGKTRFDLRQIRSTTHLLLDLQGLESI